MKFKDVKLGQFFYAKYQGFKRSIFRKPKSLGDKFIAALDDDYNQGNITWSKYVKTTEFTGMPTNIPKYAYYTSHEFDSHEEVLPAASHSYKYLTTKEARKLKKQLGNKRTWKYGISL